MEKTYHTAWTVTIDSPLGTRQVTYHSKEDFARGLLVITQTGGRIVRIEVAKLPALQSA